MQPLDNVLGGHLPKLVYLAGCRIALWRHAHPNTEFSWREPLRIGAAWLNGDIRVRGSWT